MTQHTAPGLYTYDDADLVPGVDYELAACPVCDGTHAHDHTADEYDAALGSYPFDCDHDRSTAVVQNIGTEVKVYRFYCDRCGEFVSDEVEHVVERRMWKGTAYGEFRDGESVWSILQR